MKIKIILVLLLTGILVKIGLTIIEKKSFDQKVKDLVQNEFKEELGIQEVTYISHIDVGIKETRREGLYKTIFTDFTSICNHQLPVTAIEKRKIYSYFPSYSKINIDQYFLEKEEKCLVKLVDHYRLEITALISSNHLLMTWASDREGLYPGYFNVEWIDN